MMARSRAFRWFLVLGFFTYLTPRVLASVCSGKCLADYQSGCWMVLPLFLTNWRREASPIHTDSVKTASGRHAPLASSQASPERVLTGLESRQV